jgi:tetratricopeptide (TPR) repeat protein
MECTDPANGGLLRDRADRLVECQCFEQMKSFTEKMRISRVNTLLLLLVIGVGCGCSAQFKVKRHLAKAEKYFAAQELEKAKIEYLIIQRYEPTNSVALSQLGRIFLRQGSRLQAMAYLMPARQRTPGNAAVRSDLGELFLSDGQTALAREEFVAALEKNPTNTMAILGFVATGVTPVDFALIDARLQKLAAQTGDSASLQIARANILVKQNKPADAEKWVQQALRLAPNMPEAHVEMFRFFMAHTNLAAAAQEFKIASDLAPAHSAIRLSYANFKASQGDREGAKAALKEITARAPDYLPAQEALASLALQEGNYANALSFTDRIIAQDSTRLETYQLRSMIHVGMRNPEKAVQEWEQLENRLRNFPGTRQLTKMELARAYVNNRDSDNALPLLDLVITLSSNRIDRPYLEATLLKASLQLGQNRGSEVVSSMGLLLQRTNIFQARLLLADGYRQLGRSADALNVMSRLVAENPKDPQLAFTSGLLLRELKKPAEARQAFLRSRELNPPNLPALNQLVELELAAANFPAALKLVQEEEAKTNSAPLLFLEGTVYAARKQVKEAETAFMKALELDPFFSNPYFALAGLYVDNNHQERAIQELEALLQKHTNDVRGLMLCAMLSADTGKFEKARDLYQRLIGVNPRFPAPYNNLAYIMAEKLGKLDEAYGLAKKARALDPKEPGIADTLAWILYRKEDYQQALPLIREAASERPQEAEIQYHFGMISYMVGQTDQARAALERAVASSTTFLGKDEAQRRLTLLKGGSLGQNAIPDLEASLKSQPKDVSTRMRLAALYEAASQPKKAAEKYEEVLKLNSQSAGAALHLAQLYTGPLNDPDRALQFAQKAYDLDHDNPEVNWLLGRLLYRKADYARAHPLLNAAARQLATRPEVLYDYAWAAYAVGRLSDADQAMRQILSIKPEFRELAGVRRFLELNSLYFQPQGLAAAEGNILATLKADQAHVPALMAQAGLNRQRGNAKPAIQAYENILQRFPGFTPANRELALVLAADPENQDQALKCALKAREAFPDDMELARVLGILSFQKKDYPYARTLLERVVAARPNDSEVFFRLGLTHLQLKDKPRGKQALERALALNLQGENQKIAQAELARLK